MAANPQPAPEPHHLKLEKCTLDEVIRIVGANVLRRKQSGHVCFYLADQSELEHYRFDPKLEQSRGLPVVICRVCGQISIAITNNHLRRHDLTRETYRDANHWPDAPLISPVDHNIRSASGKKRWTPERRRQQKKKMEDCWATLTPQARAEWIQNSTTALQSQEVRDKISVGTKKGLAAPGVSEKISENMVRIWGGNTKRRKEARENAIKVLNNLEIVKKARLAHDTPETSKAISEGNAESWASGRRDRDAAAALLKQRHLEARKKLAEADRILAQRTPEEIAEAARITLSADFELKGISKRAMRNDLFPKQHVLERRYDDTKQLFRRKRKQIDAEKLRLAALPLADRQAAIDNAHSHL